MNTTPKHNTSPTVTTRTHPPAQGWLHTSAMLKSSELLPLDEARLIVCCLRDPENYDIALCAQNGRTLKGCVRRKDWKPQSK